MLLLNIISIFKVIFLVKKLKKTVINDKNEKTFKIAINIRSKTVKNQKKGVSKTIVVQ